jgi:hypothetical protein
VLGGLTGLLLNVVAAIVLAGLLRPAPVITSFRLAGPVQPMLQACMMFYRWEGTHNPNFLNQAVADAYSPRVPWQSKLRFRTELSGLRSSTREANYAHSSTTSTYYEHAIQDDCMQLTTGFNSRDRPKFRRAFARLSRPSTTHE